MQKTESKQLVTDKQNKLASFSRKQVQLIQLMVLECVKTFMVLQNKVSIHQTHNKQLRILFLMTEIGEKSY